MEDKKSIVLDVQDIKLGPKSDKVGDKVGDKEDNEE